MNSFCLDTGVAKEIDIYLYLYLYILNIYYFFVIFKLSIHKIQ